MIATLNLILSSAVGIASLSVHNYTAPTGRTLYFAVVVASLDALASAVWFVLGFAAFRKRGPRAQSYYAGGILLGIFFLGVAVDLFLNHIF